jgi:hypothetical protein
MQKIHNQKFHTHSGTSEKQYTSMKNQNFFTPEEDALSIERKNTIKRYTDPYNFCIFDNESRVLKVTISPNSTIGELVSEVKNRMHDKRVIGLTSRDNNEIIDFALKIKHLPLSTLQNNMNFEVQRAG